MYNNKQEIFTAPDGRNETINLIGQGAGIILEPGIYCEALVGAHNGAVDLFTAIVTFEPGRSLERHTHPHAESITLLKGEASIEIENRRYRLHQYDNITIPAGVAHKVNCLSDKQEALFHIAMPVSTPQRQPIEQTYDHFRNIPDSTNGPSGKEYITRFDHANRYDAGMNTAFIDFFNEALLPGVAMSGGLGVFYKNGRLPAHFHAFDESICIIAGEAVCVTQNNKYTLSSLSTALQPKELPHYFINPFEEEMYMIWVYAGAMPVRTEVEDF